MLNISPWCLFINSCGTDIKIIDSIENKECLITSNNIGMPFMISVSVNKYTCNYNICNFIYKNLFTHIYFQQSFQIGLNVKNNWISTNGLYLNNSKPKEKSIQYYTVPDEGPLIVEVLSNYGLCKMILNSLNENGVRVFILSSFFVICNFTNINLNIWSFCILPKEKEKLQPPIHDSNEIGIFDVPINTIKQISNK